MPMPKTFPISARHAHSGAGFFWALYIYFRAPCGSANIGMHALTIAIGLSASLYCLLVCGIMHPLCWIPQYWGKALVIALLANRHSYALDLMALKQLSKLSYGTLSSLAPALAALAGLFLLHEQISLIQWLALSCIMIASIGVTLRGENSCISMTLFSLPLKY